MHNKAVNRTFFASLRFGVASPLYTKTPLHKKCPLQRRYMALKDFHKNNMAGRVI